MLPALVRKLILVGSGAFEDHYAANIEQTRLNRLTDEERREARSLMETLEAPSARDKNAHLARLAKLFTKADAYDPLTLGAEILEVQYHIHQRVWNEASELRRSGALLELGKQIQCPVVAIHGDYDSHPAAGVREPLSAILGSFRFVLLENCGHLPWIEKHARDRFYEILRAELCPDEH